MSLRPPRRGVALAWSLAALALTTVALATVTIPLDLDARLQRSVDAFVATVASVRSETVGDEAWTVVTLDVESWLRSGGEDVDDPAAEGSARPTVELAFLGGEAPGVPRLEVAAMPRLVDGERVLLLTHGAGGGLASPLVGFDQGIFRLVDDVWTDADGATLGLDPRGVLVLGDAATPHGEDVLAALLARLVQLGGAP